MTFSRVDILSPEGGTQCLRICVLLFHSLLGGDTHDKCLGFHHAEAVLNVELLVNLPSFQEKGRGSMNQSITPFELNQRLRSFLFLTDIYLDMSL